MLISAVAIILIFGLTQFDGQTIFSQIQQFSRAALALSLGAVLLQILCQTARLWLLFPRSLGLRWEKAAIAFIRGQFIGNWVSTQAGYAVKIWYVRPKTNRDRDQLSLVAATAIIFLDKVVDIATLAFLSAFGVIWLLKTPTDVGERGLVIFHSHINKMGSHVVSHPSQSMAILLGLLLVFYLLRQAWITQVRSLAQVESLKRQLGDSLEFLKSPSQVISASAMGFGDWIFEMLSLQCLCSALGFNLSFAQLTLCLLILNLGISVPSGIANVGSFEASLTFALMQFGIPLEHGLAISVVYHLLQLAGITIWYLIISSRKNQSPPDRLLIRRKEKVNQP